MGVVSKVKEHGMTGSVKIVLKKITSKADKIIYRLFSMLPVKKELLIFETNRDFWDNGWAYYDYLRHTKSYKYVWIVHNPKSFPNEKDTTFVSRYGLGIHIKANYYLARAGHIFYTHSIADYCKRKETHVVYLSHGCAYKDAKGSDMSGVYFDFALTTGKAFKESQAKFLKCNSDKIKALGFPRNDLLLGSKGEGRDNPLVEGKTFNRVIIWMPTFRASVNSNLSENSCDTETGLPILDTLESIQSFNEFLKAINAVVLLKVHPLQAEKEAFKHTYSNFKIITDMDIVKQNLQLYQVVAKTDALITDYSSIAVDYMLIDRPIGFTLDDYKEYSKDRGFVFDDVLSMMPGAHIYNLEELCDFVREVMEGKDLTCELRRGKMKDMHEFTDKNSSERLTSYLGL